MTSNTPHMSYSAAASQGGRNDTAGFQRLLPHDSSAKTADKPVKTANGSERPLKRSPSPSHIPKTASPEDHVYVLTLLTDKAHHDRMTELRKRYFPKAINKLAAHLTLFHALPGSKLESNIIPTLEKVASDTSAFRVNGNKPFRFKKGFAISVPDQEGGRQGSQIHKELQTRWIQDGFLSDQDSGGCRLHYTIMNKVDDEETIARSFNEVRKSWNGDPGTVEGFALWRYDHGYWKWERKFAFAAP